jgi:AcrR family transcriptional regulator
MAQTQEQKSERSRDAILDAALRLFSTQGYRGTSIREIAAEAGLSTGNVYHHFPDKESLFRTLIDRYWDLIGRPESPFNQALLDGAFPHDLEALARAAEVSVQTYRPYLNLIYVDVVEFEGTHLRKYYSGMPERFSSSVAKHHPGDTLKDQLDCHPTTAIMLAAAIFLNHYLVEHVFGVPREFGLDNATVVKELSAILRNGMLAKREGP